MGPRGTDAGGGGWARLGGRFWCMNGANVKATNLLSPAARSGGAAADFGFVSDGGGAAAAGKRNAGLGASVSADRRPAGGGDGGNALQAPICC